MKTKAEERWEQMQQLLAREAAGHDGPVSYTHLDVYKRQAISRPISVVALLFSNASGAWTFVRSNLVRPCPSVQQVRRGA